MDRNISGTKKRNRYIKYALIIVCIIGFLICLHFGVSKALKTITVKRNDIDIAIVQKGDMEGYFTADGKVIPAKKYQIEASVGGKIEKILHFTVDYVQVGEVILELSNDNLRLNILSQETALTEQVNNLNDALILNNQSRVTRKLQMEESAYTLKKAERAYNAADVLHKSKHISDEDFLSAKEDYELAIINNQLSKEEAISDSLFRKQQIDQLQQSISRIQTGLEQVRRQINDLVIRAPISGVITDMDINQGQIVAMGEKIAFIEDTSLYYIQVQVNQFYLPRLQQGQRAKLILNDKVIWLQVAKIHPKLSNDNITVDLTGELPKDLKSGQLVTVDIMSDIQKDVLYLPQGQYLMDTGEKWVFAIREGSNLAEKRQVTFGFKNMRDIEVLSGLKEGEKVITSSYKEWLNKDYVKIK